MPYFDLTGQTAIVTGAATGIGEAIARRLSGAGATVAIADLNWDGARATAATIERAFPVLVDVTDSASVDRAAAAVLAKTGQIDILVNNAGIAGTAGPLTGQTDDAWRNIIAVNMSGVFYFCRAVIGHMQARHYGRIVNISSIAGKEGNPMMTGYSATKAAVIGITKSIGKEFATEGICVNAVSPAVVWTKLIEQMPEAQVKYMTEKIPMRRTGTTEEIAAVVHFLSSPDCSFVTAQCYDASGGRATY